MKRAAGPRGPRAFRSLDAKVPEGRFFLLRRRVSAFGSDLGVICEWLGGHCTRAEHHAARRPPTAFARPRGVVAMTRCVASSDRTKNTRTAARVRTTRFPMGAQMGPDGETPGIDHKFAARAQFRVRLTVGFAIGALAVLCAACSSTPSSSPPLSSSSSTTTPASSVTTSSSPRSTSAPSTSSSVPSSATQTTSPSTTTLDTAIIAGWLAAENALYRSLESSDGLASPALPATMVNPELLLVKRNLAGDEHDGFIGRGAWDLGSPTVISLDPTNGNPNSAQVASCIHDTALLYDTQTGRVASGIDGQVDWLGSTSKMVLSSGSWKLASQSATANPKKSVACAGIPA